MLDAGFETSPEKLNEMARCDNKYVRAAVGVNGNTSMETLCLLAQDCSSVVRRSVARNKNLPIEISRYLLTDDDLEVRINALLNPAMPWLDIIKWRSRN